MMFTEAWVTFIFISVILGIKYQNAAKDLQTNAFFIGLTLSGQILVSAKSTGASLNPAVGIILPLFIKLTINENRKYQGL